MAIGDYLVKLPANLHVMQIENAYLWERHVTLRAFWRLLLQGRGAGDVSPAVTVLTLACGVAIAGGLLIRAALRGIRVDGNNSSDNPWTGECTSRRRRPPDHRDHRCDPAADAVLL